MLQEAPNRTRWPVALSVLLVVIVVAVALAAAFAPIVFPAGDRMARDGRSVAAGIIFIGSYLASRSAEFPA